MTAKSQSSSATRYMEEDDFASRMKQIRDGEIDIKKDVADIDDDSLRITIESVERMLDGFGFRSPVFSDGFAYYESGPAEDPEMSAISVGVALMNLLNPFVRQVGGSPARRHSFRVSLGARSYWLSSVAHPSLNDFLTIDDADDCVVIEFNANGLYEALTARPKAASRMDDTEVLYSRVSRVLSLWRAGDLLRGDGEVACTGFATKSDRIAFAIDSEFRGLDQADDYYAPEAGVRMWFTCPGWPDEVQIDVT